MTVTIGRRGLLAALGGAAAGWPLAARAQERMRHIGVLMGYAESDREGQANFAAFQGGLQKLGWTAGRNIRIGNVRENNGDGARSLQHRRSDGCVLRNNEVGL